MERHALEGGRGRAGLDPEGNVLPLRLCLCSFVQAVNSNRFLSPHPQQPKAEFPDGTFGTIRGFTGLLLPEEAVDPASTGTQTHRRIAKLRRSPQIKFPALGLCATCLYRKRKKKPTKKVISHPSSKVAGH